VLGFDVDEQKVSMLNKGKSYTKHIASKQFANYFKTGAVQATTDFKQLKKVDVIIICVPIPLNEMREPNLQYIESTGAVIAKYLRSGQLVSLESTTYPGTTEEVLLPLFSQK